MILHSLVLRNFKGLLAGVGLPEVRIDFDRLPSGLIAVVGGNGMGKTTILDNCHPYRLMPYKLRKSPGWSPASFSYYDECVGEAMKELIFSVGGTRYKAVILIDADRRKQEATLYRSGGMGARDWQPLNDGKTRTYDEAVEKVCGSPSLFFTSVFRAQGAKNLSDYTRGDIMAVVAELLNIDHIKEQGEKARNVSAVLQAKVDDLRRESDGLALVAASLQSLRDSHAAILCGVSTESSTCSSLRSDLDAIADKRKQLEVAASTEASTRHRIADKRLQIDRLRNELASGYMLAQREGVCRDKDAARQSLADAKAKHDAIIARLLSKRLAAQSVIANEHTIRNANDILPSMQNSLACSKEGLRISRESYAKEREALAALSGIASELVATKRHLSSLQARSGALSGLDCKGEGSGWVNEHCPLLRDAVAAKGEIPAATDAVANLEALLAGKADLEARLAEMEASGKQLADAVAVLEKEIAGTQALAAKLPHLELAVSTLAEIDTEEKAATADHEKTSTEISQHIDALVLRLAEIDKTIADHRAAKESEIAIVSEEVRQLEASIGAGLSDELAALDRSAEGVRSRLAEAEGRVSFLQSEAGALRSRIEAAEAAAAKVAEVDVKLSPLNDEIAAWNLLAKACGNDGVIALEIDDAGPSIASLANDLLRSCYGTRFSIRLETQSQKVNGDAKEDFDITVFDAETGETKSITDLSGGQVLWLEDAIVRSICLFQIENSGRSFQTIFSDEKDGALDGDRKVEFMAVKRRSMELGVHTRELFITQTAELVDMADGVIRLSPRKVEVG